MADRKKISTDELFANEQWSDNMSFSREAIKESKKKKTNQLVPKKPEKDDSQALLTGSLAPVKKGNNVIDKAKKSAPKKTTNHLDQYVQEMNDEMGRISESMGQTLDTVGERMSNSMHNMFAPIGENLTGLAEALLHGLHSMTIGVAKAIVVELTVVLRTISERLGLGGNNKPLSRPKSSQRTATHSKTAPIPHGTAPLSLEPAQAPAPSMGFGLLLEGKIFFSTIHNRPFLTELDIKEYQPGNQEQENQWMTRAIEEIRNCAPYGQKLPVPTKGPFLGIPMFDILREVDYDALEKFTTFVANRPQPFQQKALKLSEAYATWVHKGAPEK